MELSFTKMQGLGNDYIYVDSFKYPLSRPEEAAKFLSDRHFGVGGDGLVLILPSDVADFRMRIFNADGSEAQMCGNAARCVGKYVYDRNLTQKTTITLETLSGIKTLDLDMRNGIVTSVTVDMGKYSLNPEDIPVLTKRNTFINQPVNANGETVYVTCVSIGNPHTVIFSDAIESLDLAKIGPVYENHPLFPDRINTEFVQVLDSQLLRMRVWERGSGETLACGTGACASVVAAIHNGYCRYDEPITVRLLGGDLVITCRSDKTVLMCGPAAHVFDGVICSDLFD